MRLPVEGLIADSLPFFLIFISESDTGIRSYKNGLVLEKNGKMFL